MVLIALPEVDINQQHYGQKSLLDSWVTWRSENLPTI
jgi:hypothetical protein